jgi:NAD(P)-dependent dehydrogenase (short-subunit alcohol dehydrogenase family)
MGSEQGGSTAPRLGSASLDGRVIAIAGAAGGLGPVVAERLAAAGATLALTDRDQGRLDAVVAELGLGEERVDAQVVDLLDEPSAVGWAKALSERFGRIDGLLHLIGGWKGGEPLAAAPLADYEWLHDLLVRTAIHTTRAFHDHLAASEHGRFVLVSSSQAQAPGGTNAAYGATKAAAEAWTLALADSFRTADSAATANILVVNAIVTPRMRAESPEKAFKTFTSAEQIAAAIEFTCSDGAQRMNGKRLALYP